MLALVCVGEPDRSVVMKRILFVLLIAGVMTSCSKKSSNVSDTTLDAKLDETTKVQNSQNEVVKSVNKMTEREFSFNPDVKFVYTEADDYMKAITDDMVLMSEDLFGDQAAVEIPTPYIVKRDLNDKNDIKFYGNFWIYGYEMYGTIFNTKNGSSNPGCYHLKDEDGKITVVSKEFAEDGSKNWESLVKICGNDEALAKKIYGSTNDESEQLRLEYAKMYAKENNLKFSGIKDYGWPVILLDDISDAEFLYNFYSAYFYEIRQDDVLNDMTQRLENLKNKYMTTDLIKKMDDMTMDAGADMIINAQDVTESMLDTLQVDDEGNGNLKVTYDLGTESSTEINVKLSKKNGKKIITDISYK